MGSLFSSKFSSSSSRNKIFFCFFFEGGLFIFFFFFLSKKRIKNILLHFFKGWFLYFHLNFLLLPVTKEEIIKKYSSSTSLRGGLYFQFIFSYSFSCQKKEKKGKIFFFYCYEGVSLFSSKFSSSSFPKRRKN